MHKFTANIDHNSDGVATFDPIQVIARLRAIYPDLEDDFQDHLLSTCKAFAREGETNGALKIAVKDLYERGPAIRFRIPLDDGRELRGVAERYWVILSCEDPIPKVHRPRIRAFLSSLFFQEIKVVEEGPSEAPEE